jgi:hypothetical protein
MKRRPSNPSFLIAFALFGLLDAACGSSGSLTSCPGTALAGSIDGCIGG